MKGLLSVMVFLCMMSLVACTATHQHKKIVKKSHLPNILFAIADDADMQFIDAYSKSNSKVEFLKMPNFDKVASQGILFNNAYTPNAKCAPSRACILTGKNSWQLKAAANHWALFPKDIPSYVEVLKGKAGYFVGWTGKPWSPGVAINKKGQIRNLAGTPYNDIKLVPPTKLISNIDYTANFKAFLKDRPEGKPFCFWYGCKEPHRKYVYGSGIKVGGKSLSQVKDSDIPPYWPKSDSVKMDLLDYALETEHFDQHLGTIIAVLDSIGELDNTIVVVTSDNGMAFPRIKGQVYDQANHLPLAIMWKKGIKNSGRKVDDYVSFIDFAPTFLEMAGIKDKMETTGKSLLDIFNSPKAGNSVKGRDYVLLGKERHDACRPNDHGYPIRAIVKNNMLYIKNFEPTWWPIGNPETGFGNCANSPTKSVILNLRRYHNDWSYWQYNFGKRPAEEFYDLNKDPFCMKNEIKNGEYANTISAMKKTLMSDLKIQKDPRILGRPDYFDKFNYMGATGINYYQRLRLGEKVHTGWIKEPELKSAIKEWGAHSERLPIVHDNAQLKKLKKEPFYINQKNK